MKFLVYFKMQTNQDLEFDSKIFDCKSSDELKKTFFDFVKDKRIESAKNMELYGRSDSDSTALNNFFQKAHYSIEWFLPDRDRKTVPAKVFLPYSDNKKDIRQCIVWV